MQLAAAPSPYNPFTLGHIKLVFEKAQDSADALDKALASPLPGGQMSAALSDRLRDAMLAADYAAGYAEMGVSAALSMVDKATLPASFIDAVRGVSYMAHPVSAASGYLRALGDAKVVPADQTMLKQAQYDAQGLSQRLDEALKALQQLS